MNQILVTEDKNLNQKKNKTKTKKERTSEPASINTIIRFFCITIIIFGIALSGNGAYSFSKEMHDKKTASVPVITTKTNGNEIKLTISNKVPIREIKYAWNSSKEIKVVSCNNKTEVELTINIISGNNKLNITVIDANSKSTQFVKNYIQQNDTTKPEITISNEDPKIKITVTDDTALDHIVYKYGNNEEVKISATEDSPTKIETYIDEVQSEQMTLTVQAVDKAQNFASVEQQVKGATKAKIEATPDPTDPSYIIIKVNDNDKIRMVAFTINGVDYTTDPNISLNSKDFEYKLKVEKGQTNIKIKAYNVSEQVTEFEGVYNY